MDQLGLAFDAGSAPPHAVAHRARAASDECAASHRNSPTPLARRSDPSTSKQAAASAKDLAREHHVRILAALEQADATIYELAERTGLTHVQVARRMPELEKLDKACTTDETRLSPSGRACRVWAICR